MITYKFHANGLDFGTYIATNENEAKELFAVDAGYKNWQAMIDQAEEFGGNTVEFYEINN